MDHLPLPQNATWSSEERIPYLCTDEYDCGPFLSFPARHEPQYAQFLSDKSIADYGDQVRDYLFWASRLSPAERLQKYGDRFEPVNLQELGPFLQSWLFFGLLHEILGEHYHVEDYIAQEQGTSCGQPIRHVSTKKLHSNLQAWLDRELKSPDAPTHVEHISQCVNRLLNALNLVGPWQVGYSLNLSVMLSIATLGEIVSDVLDTVSKTRKFTPAVKIQTVLVWKEFFDKISAETSMLQSGWCPLDVARVWELDVGLSSRIYLSKLNRHRTKARHSKCSDIACAAFQVDESRYLRAHREDGCKCDDIKVDLDTLSLALSSGSFPILKILPGQQLSDLSVDVLIYEPGVPFIAISHVWADGLGNPLENAMPRCQLQYLGKAAETLLSRVTSMDTSWRRKNHFSGSCARWGKRHSSKRVFQDRHWCSFDERLGQRAMLNGALIWIDTICCPVPSGQPKRNALDRMHEVYNEAAAVLVLDDTLQNENSAQMQRMEFAARILCAPWATRLWTLQEATLAVEIFIQFRDQILDFHTIWFRLQSRSNATITETRIEREMSRLLKMIKTQEFVGWDEEFGTQELQVAVQSRRVKKARDEPFCLANLMNLDTSSILDASNVQTKVCAFWTLLSESNLLPAYIIFNSGERITREGYTWAPYSLLALPEAAESMTWSAGYRRRGKIGLLGLHVEFPALKLRKPYPHVRLITQAFGWDPDANPIQLRHGPKEWFFVSIKEKGFVHSNDRRLLYSYLSNPPHEATCIIARAATGPIIWPGKGGSALIGIESNYSEAGPRIFKSHAVVEILRHDPLRTSLLELSYTIAQDIRESELGENIRALQMAGPEVDQISKERARVEVLRVCNEKALGLTRATLGEAPRKPGERASRSENIVATYSKEFFCGLFYEAVASYPVKTEWIIE